MANGRGVRREGWEASWWCTGRQVVDVSRNPDALRVSLVALASRLIYINADWPTGSVNTRLPEAITRSSTRRPYHCKISVRRDSASSFPLFFLRIVWTHFIVGKLAHAVLQRVTRAFLYLVS